MSSSPDYITADEFDLDSLSESFENNEETGSSDLNEQSNYVYLEENPLEMTSVPGLDYVKYYELLMEGDVSKLESWAEETLGRSIEGNEAMIIEIASCRHGHSFESFNGYQVSTWLEWLANKKCPCFEDSDDCEIGETKTYASVYPMHIAVHKKNYELINYLVKLGNTVNVKAFNTRVSPIYNIMISFNDDDALNMTEELHKAGADLQILIKNGASLLHACAFSGKLKTLTYLLEHGAKNQVNLLTDLNNTPLILATRGNYVAVAQKLIECGASVNICSRMQVTPLFCALRQANRDMAMVLLSREDIDVNIKPTSGYRNMAPLHLAVQQMDEAIVELLLARGADPNESADSGISPLVFCAYINSPKLARILLMHGADCNKANVQGYTAMHNACWDGHEELVRLLLGAKARHDEKTNDGNTPLSLACHGSQSRIVDLLIPIGCNINNTDKDSDTPLHYTTYNGDLNSTKALLEAGALPDFPNRLVCTPTWNAAYRAHADVLRILLRYNPDLSIHSKGIQQEAQTEGVTECFPEPKSVFYAACYGCSQINSRRNNPTAEILMKAGIKLKNEEWLLEPLSNDMRPNWMTDYIWHRVKAHFKEQPQSLLHHCRTNIRELLRGWCNLEHQVNKMEIPVTLKAFLVTKDL